MQIPRALDPDCHFCCESAPLLALLRLPHAPDQSLPAILPVLPEVLPYLPESRQIRHALLPPVLHPHDGS